MNKLASTLPLQDMIRSVIANATEKLAANETTRDGYVRRVASGPSYSERSDTRVSESDISSFPSPDFVEKLASACDLIAGNIDNIEGSQVSVLRSALQKMATEDSLVGPGKGPGALAISKAIGGVQSHKKDKPKGPDAAASQAHTPLSTGGFLGGYTQLDNDMHHAPGGTEKKAGISPYLLAGAGGAAVGGATGAAVSQKGHRLKGALIGGALGAAGGTAGVAGLKGVGKGIQERLEEVAEIYRNAGHANPFEHLKTAGISPYLLAGAGGAAVGGATGAAVSQKGHRLKGALIGGALGAAGGTAGVAGLKGVGKGIQERLARGPHILDTIDVPGVKFSRGKSIQEQLDDVATSFATRRKGKLKNAEVAKAHILRKLAGEDVFKANITSPRTANPLAGMGQLATSMSGQAFQRQAGDASSTVLKENLRNTGNAGVKIAAARAALQKIAMEKCQCDGKGECKYCQMKAALKARASVAEKTANAMMGYGGGSGMGQGISPPPSTGMSSMASAGASADGCQCNGTGECRVCKLKAALAAAKASGDTSVEKDAQ